MKCKYCKEMLVNVDGQWEELTGIMRSLCGAPGNHSHHVPETYIVDRDDLIAGAMDMVAKCNSGQKLAARAEDELAAMSDAELIQYALDTMQNIGAMLKPVKLALDAEIEETWVKQVDLTAIRYVPAPTEEKE